MSDLLFWNSMWIKENASVNEIIKFLSKNERLTHRAIHSDQGSY